MSDLFVTKDSKTGEYRWTLISSSAYLDRDKEIVTEEALEEAVAHMKATGEYGDLRYWHTGVVIGKADYADVFHHQLLESGTFVSKEVAERTATQSKQLGASIGFKHTKEQPIQGIYRKIRIKERSILPRGKESNLFTRLSVTGGDMQVTKAMLEEKKEGLYALYGEDVGNQLLSQMEATAKEADESGVVRKEKKEPSLWERLKESLGAIPAPDPDPVADEDDTEELEVPTEKKEASEPTFTLEQVKELVSAEVGKLRDEWATQRTKETSTFVTQAEIVEVVKPLAAAQEVVVKEVAALKQVTSALTNDIPKGLAGVFRASQDGSTATEKAEKQAEKMKQPIDPMDVWLTEKFGA